MLFFRRLFQVDKIDAVYFLRKGFMFKPLKATLCLRN